ncbi:MAG: 23S rRNA (adenine(2030)-N(6))-methyltransferase RlmJ [Bauldia sp.]|uniref:23S rRNA (adenine(2030)-N(6))-methyltransferase RlmJ n=1 Tax=Bauldia sp. TaxID=2575872 RepID=UPI001D248800|nr:23S rRNA (adenine(2030)-N(6))-methyltransferase RlmJ [Bauldia sp.]MCB1497995.1 23S rRNA (adenine(2030)-N(6))-methyltransferase RlmJ [Bauldia sp.]
MNYRHAYHAGNHTEVFKHPVLVMLLEHLRKKPKPFTVLDTHAGIGLYDLASVEAGKTGEWTEGIARVIGVDIPVAATYLDSVRDLNPDGLAVYPGSPAIIRAMLRDDDRLIACELHPEDATALRRAFRGDRRIAIHARDGYEAIGAFVPPPTRRGLVFIDPPYEARDEFARLADALNTGIAKWPTGIFAAWYPLKDRNGIETLKARYSPDNPPTLVGEFLRAPIDGEALAGSGLLICNPPWGLEEKLAALCEALLPALGVEATGSYAIDWWTTER